MRAAHLRSLSPDIAAMAPSHEEISARAYELYMERSALDGSPENDWLRAERELLEDRLLDGTFAAPRRRAMRRPIEHDLASK